MFEQITTLIEKRMQDEWLLTPVDYDNEDFKVTPGKPFVRLRIYVTDTRQISCGGRDRSTGYIEISLFERTNKGGVEMDLFADTIKKVFQRWEKQGLKCFIATLKRVGQREEFFQKNLIIPFQYDECQP